MNSREVIKKLQYDGWLLHHTKGDHHQFKHPKKPGKVTVPHPTKVLLSERYVTFFGRQDGIGGKT